MDTLDHPRLLILKHDMIVSVSIERSSKEVREGSHTSVTVTHPPGVFRLHVSVTLPPACLLEHQ